MMSSAIACQASLPSRSCRTFGEQLRDYRGQCRREVEHDEGSAAARALGCEAVQYAGRRREPGWQRASGGLAGQLPGVGGQKRTEDPAERVSGVGTSAAAPLVGHFEQNNTVTAHPDEVANAFLFAIRALGA